jgi:sugar O-acyltransferase (sialic acid O-acetyltransferase NeuD family)
MEKLILYGNGAVAEVLHYLYSREGRYRIVAFTVDRHLVGTGRFHDLPLVPWDEVAARYPPAEHRMMIAVGYVRVNRLRAERFQQAREMGYRLVSYVSPAASLWDGFLLGENCRFGENVRIQPYASIGDDVFIGTDSLIGHHSVIKDHCYLSASVRIAGHVTVEPYCYIGINATIRNRVTIAPACVIGAGAVILGDTVEKGVYMSQPAELLSIASDRLSPA